MGFLGVFTQLNSGSYATFSCIDSHEHNHIYKVLKDHDDVGGYQFVNTACFGCHPNRIKGR